LPTRRQRPLTWGRARVCEVCVRRDATRSRNLYLEGGTSLSPSTHPSNVCPFSPPPYHFGRYRRRPSSGKLEPFALVRPKSCAAIAPVTQGSTDGSIHSASHRAPLHHGPRAPD